jgi:hypothetical protein
LLFKKIFNFNIYILISGLSNRENSLSIQLAVLAIKNNIPCDDNNCSHKWFYEDLPNKKGFQRVLKCNKSLQTWKPFAMIDKSRPTKSAIKDILRGTFLCWFHVMQTFGENLNQWAIPWQIR